MVLMDRRERDAIIARFPKAEIVKTRHRYFLVGSDITQTGRLLMELRGITPPPSRRERARSGNNRRRTY